MSLDHDYFSASRAPRIAWLIKTLGFAKIATFSAADQRWAVYVEADHRFQKEGDWTLSIRDTNRTRLVSCTFCIATPGGKLATPRLLIGCVQGPDTSINGRELYRVLTKQWYGLRPKPFVVYLAQSLAYMMGATSSMIVSNEAHVYSHWRYRRSRHRIAADYQNLAKACGAAKPWKGWYLLGLPERRTLSTPVRKAQRQRQLLIDSLSAQIRRAIVG